VAAGHKRGVERDLTKSRNRPSEGRRGGIDDSGQNASPRKAFGVGKSAQQGGGRGILFISRQREPPRAREKKSQTVKKSGFVVGRRVPHWPEKKGTNPSKGRVRLVGERGQRKFSDSSTKRDRGLTRREKRFYPLIGSTPDREYLQYFYRARSGTAVAAPPQGETTSGSNTKKKRLATSAKKDRPNQRSAPARGWRL